MRGGGRTNLTAAQQYLFLRHNPLCAGGHGILDVVGLAWEYAVRPSTLSREYNVRIEYQKSDTPKVFVVSPDPTELAGGRPLPHIYRDPVRLCLYLPGSGEWEGWMRIDQTFVPWTATWLYYFEEWLFSNEWKGGGEHPLPDDHEHSNRRTRRSLPSYSAREARLNYRRPGNGR